MSKIAQAIETVQDMLDVLETAGSCYVYKHSGGAGQLRNVLECLREHQELESNLRVVESNPPVAATLADIIRSMSDETLASFIMEEQSRVIRKY